MSALLKQIPTVYASSELRRLRHAGSSRRWERGDLIDISALSVATVYCDVVVTERQWRSVIHQAKLDERNMTVVLSDVAQLGAHIV
jgi:hypothetical protein